MILQKDVFYEDKVLETESVIKKHFPAVKVVPDEDIMVGNVPKNYAGPFRGSLFLATRLGLAKRFDFCNAIKWAPPLREMMISKDFFFQDAYHLGESFDRLEQKKDGKLFIRPTKGNKVFSGNVFDKETFKNEFEFFTKNKNESPYTLCMVASPKHIEREWRVIYAGGKYCGASQYMVRGEIDVKADVPPKVIKFAEEITKKDYFQNIFDFVIDIGETDDTKENPQLGLIEINGLETASFYAADLDQIYSTWASSL
jgi:ATP-grasp domain, R2K clade family 3